MLPTAPSVPPPPDVQTYHRTLHAHVASLLSTVSARRRSVPPNNPNRKPSVAATDASASGASASAASVRPLAVRANSGRSRSSSMVTPSLVGDGETKGSGPTATETDQVATVFDDDDEVDVAIADGDVGGCGNWDGDADDGRVADGGEDGERPAWAMPVETAKPRADRSAHATPCAPRLTACRLAPPSPETPSERAEEYRRAWETEGKFIWANMPPAFELRLDPSASRSRRGSRESCHPSEPAQPGPSAAPAHAHGSGLGLGLSTSRTSEYAAASPAPRALSYAPSQGSLRSSARSPSASARCDERHRRRAAELRARVERWLAAVAPTPATLDMPDIFPDIPSPSAFRRDAFRALGADPHLGFPPLTAGTLRPLASAHDLVLPLIPPLHALPLIPPLDALPSALPPRDDPRFAPAAAPAPPDGHPHLAAKRHAIDQLSARADMHAPARRISATGPYVPLGPPVDMRAERKLDALAGAGAGVAEVAT
ncbi:hypothetical protein Q5752_004537 [Cryptotrichosporon argae]